MSKLDVIKRETMLSTTNAWIKRLSAFANSNDIQFDNYQKDIVVNTVRKIGEMGYDIFSYEQNNVADILYQTAFLRLNPSATPNTIMRPCVTSRLKPSTIKIQVRHQVQV